MWMTHSIRLQTTDIKKDVNLYWMPVIVLTLLFHSFAIQLLKMVFLIVKVTSSVKPSALVQLLTMQIHVLFTLHIPTTASTRTAIVKAISSILNNHTPHHLSASTALLEVSQFLNLKPGAIPTYVEPPLSLFILVHTLLFVLVQKQELKNIWVLSLAI